MKIKQINEELMRYQNLFEDDKTKQELENQDKRLYEIVPYALYRTKDRRLLTEFYAYFDDRYKVVWQGGLRNDDRGMILCYWTDRDNPDELCLYLTSDHNNIYFSGSTHWAVPAKTFDDKVAVLKQIKQDIDEIAATYDKLPKTLYGEAWTKDSYNGVLSCSLCVSEKGNGHAGFIMIDPPKDKQGEFTGFISCSYCEPIQPKGSSAQEVLDAIKDAVKDKITFILPDISNVKVESLRHGYRLNFSKMNESYEPVTEDLLKANQDEFYKIFDRDNSNCIVWDGTGFEVYIFEYMDGNEPMYSNLSRFKTFDDAMRVARRINRNNYNYDDCVRIFPNYDDMQI